jgi:hypothetical protein
VGRNVGLARGRHRQLKGGGREGGFIVVLIVDKGYVFIQCTFGYLTQAARV